MASAIHWGLPSAWQKMMQWPRCTPVPELKQNSLKYSSFVMLLEAPQVWRTKWYHILETEMVYSGKKMLYRNIWQTIHTAPSFMVKCYKWRVLLQNGLSAIFDLFKGHHCIIQNNTFLMIPFSLYINEYFWSYDQKYYKFSYYILYISAA